MQKLKNLDEVYANQIAKRKTLQREILAEYRKESELVNAVVEEETTLQKATRPIFERHRTELNRRRMSEDYVRLVYSLDRDGLVSNSWKNDLPRPLRILLNGGAWGVIFGGIASHTLYAINGEELMGSGLLTCGIAGLAGLISMFVPTAVYAMENSEKLNELKNEVTYLDQKIHELYHTDKTIPA